MKSGYTDLRMADVAKAGMATGTLYIYFKNKEELINTLFLQLKEEKIKQMFENTQPTDSFFISFKKLWSAYFTISLKEFPKMLFIEQYAYSSLLSAETKSGLISWLPLY
ncbi:MAG: TetR/AcrR family transcriptional regulator [Saprospiraceae bacterium]|nr:TetR/AcrR family transcriptional regulator [Saprospiraceae bacterium]